MIKVPFKFTVLQWWNLKYEVFNFLYLELPLLGKRLSMAAGLVERLGPVMRKK